ncbi:DUF805 domain-containing protein [Stenotrophomonas maltophilia]|uniref:DUF805 domain-containing protein n=2 Tax=Stenotrophomonas maltophilia group TaxID=995085 RepID=UPI003D187794
MENIRPRGDSARFFLESTPMHKMMIPLTRYAQFSGRASRSEFWWFQLFILIVFMPLHVLSFIAGYTGSEALAWVSTGLGVVVWLALLVPLVSVTVRRLHDTDRSGWWYLLLLVPFANLAVLVFMLLPGTPGGNRFGAPVPHV